MQGITLFAVRLIRAATRAYERKWTFLAISFAVFAANALALANLDLLPSAPKAVPAVIVSAQSAAAVEAEAAIAVPEEPVQVAIPAINLTATIANPESTNVETLDGYLLKGAVRYPTSAELGEVGNVVLFGHSSYLPIVGNQAYKTFDGIQKLAVGDTITVSSATTTYTYAVRSVAKESAASDAGIPLDVSGRELTLVTCNSFAQKTDRFVVTADFVESHPIPTT